MSDQDGYSAYNVDTKSSRHVMRIKKNINWGLLVDPILNSPNKHQKNYMTDSKENHKRDFGSERVNRPARNFDRPIECE